MFLSIINLITNLIIINKKELLSPYKIKLFFMFYTIQI